MRFPIKRYEQYKMGQNSSKYKNFTKKIGNRGFSCIFSGRAFSTIFYPTSRRIANMHNITEYSHWHCNEIDDTLSSDYRINWVQTDFLTNFVVISKVKKNHTNKDSTTANIVILSHRHFRIVESNIVNSTAGQVNPTIPKSLNDYGIRYIDVDHERYRVNFLQSLSLQACSGKS